MTFLPSQHPHRRFNPLSGEWILVSPHRTQRPWQGHQEGHSQEQRPAYDPSCYLCPGNARAGGAVNPQYNSPFVFTNDYAALLPGSHTVATPPKAASGESNTGELLESVPVKGECRVICFSPRHDLTLPEMPVAAIRQLIEVWSEQMAELGSRYRWVQTFENKGAIMGCSNPHPHGQIWASDFLPRFIEQEDRCQHEYWGRHGRTLLMDYVSQELVRQERLVEANEHWVFVVPYWATWPFELLLAPRRPVSRLTDLTGPERLALAEILRRGLTRYDNLFETSFPYSMGWHGAPWDDRDPSPWVLHAHFYPPLLRSAQVKKFMVGYEMLAEPQRDLTPEQAAQRLCATSIQHYRLP